jgi:hypothetical protein
MSFQEYLKKVIWYCHHEYETPDVTVEEFYDSPNANLWSDSIFKSYSKNTSVPECSGLLIEECKNFYESQK